MSEIKSSYENANNFVGWIHFYFETTDCTLLDSDMTYVSIYGCFEFSDRSILLTECLKMYMN
jgi:hypothetical protein